MLLTMLSPMGCQAGWRAMVAGDQQREQTHDLGIYKLEGD
jgi:hypothetical protein